MTVLLHGEYQLERHGQIIFLSCIGAWNDYTARRMCEEFLSHAKTISDHPWGCLTDLTKWELGAPDIWPPLQKLYQWSANHNQSLAAMVTVTRLQKILMTRAYEHLPKMNIQYFSEGNSALLWLAENGLDISDTRLSKDQTHFRKK
jgi:hypothetical protein